MVIGLLYKSTHPRWMDGSIIARYSRNCKSQFVPHRRAPPEGAKACEPTRAQKGLPLPDGTAHRAGAVGIGAQGDDLAPPAPGTSAATSPSGRGVLPRLVFSSMPMPLGMMARKDVLHLRLEPVEARVQPPALIQVAERQSQVAQHLEPSPLRQLPHLAQIVGETRAGLPLVLRREEVQVPSPLPFRQGCGWSRMVKSSSGAFASMASMRSVPQTASPQLRPQAQLDPGLRLPPGRRRTPRPWGPSHSPPGARWCRSGWAPHGR